MQQALGIFLLVLLFAGIAWAVWFGNDLGKCIAQSQASKRREHYELERRLKELERKIK